MKNFIRIKLSGIRIRTVFLGSDPDPFSLSKGDRIRFILFDGRLRFFLKVGSGFSWRSAPDPGKSHLDLDLVSTECDTGWPRKIILFLLFLNISVQSRRKKTTGSAYQRTSIMY